MLSWKRWFGFLRGSTHYTVTYSEKTVTLSPEKAEEIFGPLNRKMSELWSLDGLYSSLDRKMNDVWEEMGKVRQKLDEEAQKEK